FAACRKANARNREEVPLPIEELGKLLAEDSVTGRMRAIAELNLGFAPTKRSPTIA
ncbi:hypothetical protein V3C99_006695, partial [Haemonchus contortus]